MTAIEQFEQVRHLAKSAVFSPCRRYRYVLVRNFEVDTLFESTALPIVFIGLNPSTADEIKPDPTITRLIGFAQTWGYSGLIMLNLFAWRETDRLKMIREVAEPIGEENDAVIRHCCSLGYDVCACWGADGDHRNRHQDISTWLPSISSISCFGLNDVDEKTGIATPKHPLYLRSDTERELLWPKVEARAAQSTLF